MTVVAHVRHDSDFTLTEDFLGPVSHREKLMIIQPLVGHVLLHNQMVLAVTAV